MRRLTAAFCLAFVAGLACGPTTTPSPKAGEPCREENVGACESPTRLLACQDKVWKVASDCKGAEGCRRSGDTIECDTRGNGVGDACSIPGRVRCDPDGGLQILRCSPESVLVVQFSCPENLVQGVPVQTVCGLSDAGLTCL